jgi:hypothetical protein
MEWGRQRDEWCNQDVLRAAEMRADLADWPFRARQMSLAGHEMVRHSPPPVLLGDAILSPRSLGTCGLESLRCARIAHGPPPKLSKIEIELERQEQVR